MLDVESIRIAPQVIRCRVSARKVTPQHIHEMARQFLGYGSARVWLVDMETAETFDPRAIGEAKVAIAPMMTQGGLESIVLITTSSLIRMAAATVRAFLHFRLTPVASYDAGIDLARVEAAR